MIISCCGGIANKNDTTIQPHNHANTGMYNITKKSLAIINNNGKFIDIAESNEAPAKNLKEINYEKGCFK